MIKSNEICTDWLQVKKQHLERNVQFLADELKVATVAEAKDRVYFVSAREALICRLQSAGVVPGTPGAPGKTSPDRGFVLTSNAVDPCGLKIFIISFKKNGGCFCTCRWHTTDRVSRSTFCIYQF